MTPRTIPPPAGAPSSEPRRSARETALLDSTPALAEAAEIIACLARVSARQAQALAEIDELLGELRGLIA